MRFCIGERMGLLNILPEQGTIATMRVLRQLRDDLGFSEDDTKLAKIRQADGKVHWDAECELEKDVSVGDVGRQIILDAVKALDAKGEVTDLTLALFERFDETSRPALVAAEAE